MKKSKLQFKNPRLKKLSFEVNNNFKKDEKIELDIDSKTNINRTGNKANVSLTLNIFKKEDLEKVPFFIQIEMSGEFRWPEELEEELLNVLLNSNAPAILLSYIRPYISTVTSGAGYPALILPLIDFTQNQSENKKV